VCNS